ncbi:MULTISPECIES: PDR/VanB family oxidoreductase [unclassified Massilia]|uniref:PDR/VanB family oxidoreductase n=1 Tax=unclassified Massilia TaxID=2609279 RepID=UPI000AA4085E|nr:MULTISPECIES: PDR/VanB family oxidoreductase [unclassified Massilia]
MEMTQTQFKSHGQTTLSLLVRQIRFEASGINSYELVHPQGEALPPFSAGAHIDIHLPNGMTRQYSLCNSPAERHRYVIAVLRDEKGRGGSRALHEALRVQDLATVSGPRNNFELVPGAKKAILLAGGIGVTPLKSMAHALDAAGIPFELHYCARNPGCAAFREELGVAWTHGKLVHHFDHGKPEQGLDIAGLLREPEEGTHLFYCGPAGFMKACAEAASHWPAGAVHFEHFKAPEPAAGAKALAPGAFMVKIASSGAMLEVPADRSIADVLEQNNIRIETSCQAGLCATCKIRYLEGEVEHRDYILGDDEHGQFLTACVSRAASGLLVLDL